MNMFIDLFPTALPPRTLEQLAQFTTRHHICLVDPAKVHNQCGFAIPRKWHEQWKHMLEAHLAAGQFQPSISLYASAAFVIPKEDPDADSQWVNDYRWMNFSMVEDCTTLPLLDVVLANAVVTHVWGKID
ncbi:hypothetical protein JCM10207_000367 [Rhodosporidiobolus poonsookiae]